MTKHYFGTKRIIARSMTRQEYNDYRGWTLPADENDADAGYLVEYTDGGQANHRDHKGYISWSPEAVFDAAYQPSDALSFGHALVALKAGHKVARAGWNGKGMWLALVHDIHKVKQHGTTSPAYRLILDGADQWLSGGPEALPWIGMKTADNKFVPWLASQTDVLADDWQIVE